MYPHPNTSYPHVTAWINSVAANLEPESIVWIDGSESEGQLISHQLVLDGTFTKLNPEKYPNCFWSTSDPSDVARVEERTFICSPTKAEAGPTNNWCWPDEMYAKLKTLMQGAMKGRTMYVMPYMMGPDGSKFSKVGFELTDSLYVVANMRIMSRVGEVALKNLSPDSNDFIKGIHSTGTIDPVNRYIAHFPADNTIVSFNSNYGGNALQGKKCFALRIASILGRDEGWLAEHMLIVGITNPEGKKHYIAAAFPSACGKTNLAMLIPPDVYQKRGWKVETVGDDIAWLRPGKDGQLYAVNPEAGFFGVAPGTNKTTNPNALSTVQSNTIFTNTAINPDDMTPWWEGLSRTPPHLIDWKKHEWTDESEAKAAHPNSRFTAPAKQCPCIDPDWENPEGVPISAIIFGGRRPTTMPLVFESRDWQHGVYLGATMASETTAAAGGKVGMLRHDPMAMLPFCGYNMAKYFEHWLSFATKLNNLPKVFHVNWFRQTQEGKFLWPGFGDNLRVIEWCINRVENNVEAEESKIGFIPKSGSINTAGLGMSESDIQSLFEINPVEWARDIESQEKFFQQFGNDIPSFICEEWKKLKSNMNI